MRKTKGSVITCASSWSTLSGPCQIKNAFPGPDNGEYWCETGRKKSNTVNITVTAGSVILESPVLPVTEGDNVTLCCRTKQTSSNLNAEFCKDGHFMESSSTGNMTIHSVSRSNEGLYKCSISGAGESAESWLTVRATPQPPPAASQLSLLICVGVSFFLMALLPLVGLLLCRSHQTVITVATYAVITEPRKEKGNELDLLSGH
ncbi:low affinity immunoglobulin gamma Fc region receptor II-b-like [Micropterus salmoides]|uniref:low affinity immunoglobulin gamma Fc region receptor II-b-like n=1 Tax=Micropterus salmoides TaxID=27706 RepID=UPI0018ECE88B|nr:low affinity immunoglobulin gamma Fc region receptor II-b-like [Micropterus salmoides]